MQAAVMAQSRTPVPPQVPGDKSESQDILIMPGDLLNVTVFDTPELSRDVRVSGDGTINLPLLGDILVANLNEAEASRRVNDAYLQGGFVLRPQTSILIREFASKGVSVLGEVVHPGIYPVQGPRTVIDVLALAGGLTITADTRITIQHGSIAKEQETVTIPFDNASKSLASDVQVFPGDRVLVPRASLVYVLGDVTRPGGFVMQDNGKITILQAVAQANGTTKTAGENRVVLLRRNADSYSTLTVALRDIYKGRKPDIAMQPDDVLYVPSSNLRNFVVSAPQILGSLAGAAIYAVANH